MSLFIPTSTGGTTPEPYNILKGMLYNLDNDEYFEFQFNPQTFIWERQINWSRTKFKGDSSGGHVDFLNLEPREFDLTLLFIADPSAPSVNYYSEERLTRPVIDATIDFEALLRLIKTWETPIDGIGRPAVIKIIIGENIFDCVIESYQVQETNFFPDLTVREGTIVFSFKEWNQVA